MSLPRAFSNLLVVCTGNICRSPMAEAFLRARLDGTSGGTIGPDIGSAGIAAVLEAPAHEHAIEVMAEKGLSLDGHRGRQIDFDPGREYDLVLVMEARQRNWILQRYPELQGRVYRLAHWSRRDIPDPIGCDLGLFRETRDLIEHAVDAWAQRMQQ